MTVIKDDIVHSVIKNITQDRKSAKNLVESILSIIKDTLASGEGILISGFGDFKVRKKNSRIGRNPKTKVAYEISERTVVTFHPSKVFKKLMNPDAD